MGKRPNRSDVEVLSSKTYTHSVGLSCCFRQWGASSHCSKLHGYALQVSVIFSAKELDGNGWVQDFGGLKEFKEWLQETFDHKVLVAKDDPETTIFMMLEHLRLIDLVFVDGTGCESFALMIFNHLESYIAGSSGGRVQLEAVEVKEHEANSAIVCRKKEQGFTFNA